MTSRSLVTVIILTVSCIALSACSNDGATTYSARVLNTSQDECPSSMQQETLIAEVKEDVRSILSQVQNGEYMIINASAVFSYMTPR